MNRSNPEVGRDVAAAGIRTNYHDVTPDASDVPAFANWRGMMPGLAARARVIAPDVVGFGFTDRPAGYRYTLDNWVSHAIGVLDALKLEQVDVIGNSFGGALALALAVRHRPRGRRAFAGVLHRTAQHLREVRMRGESS